MQDIAPTGVFMLNNMRYESQSHPAYSLSVMCMQGKGPV